MKPRFKDKIFIALIAVGLLTVVYGRMTGAEKEDLSNGYPIVKAKIKGIDILLEVPQTQQEKSKGLGQRESLGENQGMLFVFDNLGQHPFVMTGMQFPLDFLFIQGDQIVDVAQNVPPDFGGRIIGGADYDKVIELNAGWAERNGVGLGERIEILNSKD